MMRTRSVVALFGPTLVVALTMVFGILLSILTPNAQKSRSSTAAEDIDSAVVLRLPDSGGSPQEAGAVPAASDASPVSAEADIGEQRSPAAPEKSSPVEGTSDQKRQDDVAEASGPSVAPSASGEANAVPDDDAPDDRGTGPLAANDVDGPLITKVAPEASRDGSRDAVSAEVAQNIETSPGAELGMKTVDQISSDQTSREMDQDVPTSESSQVAATTKAQETVLPDSVSTQPVEAAPIAPRELFLIDAVRQQLNTPERRQGAHPDDLAALEDFYAQYSGPARWLTTAGLTPEAKKVIAEISRAGEWGLDPKAFALPSLDFRGTKTPSQADAEILIDLAILKYARAARGGRAEPNAVSKLFNQKPPLREPREVLDGVAVANAPDVYLRDLHPKHPQFEALRQMLVEARSQGEDTEAEKQKLLVNMERWRWMPEDLGDYYIWANIPEFELRVVKDSKTIASEKMVVGNPKTPTPILSADLKSVVFNPERIVPLSVIRREVLPKLQKSRGWMGRPDTSVLEQYQLTVMNKGRTVDPARIDWKEVDLSKLTFVQAPGPNNTLGKVQFLYPNSQGVFMHDTIIPSQLVQDVRAAGEQNPRVANPERLAVLLLKQGKGWSKSRTDESAKKENAEVYIDKPIPVHTTYFTAIVDDNGTLKSLDDVYKLDAAVERIISSKEQAAALATQITPIPPRKPAEATGVSSADR